MIDYMPELINEYKEQRNLKVGGLLGVWMGGLLWVGELLWVSWRGWVVVGDLVWMGCCG